MKAQFEKITTSISSSFNAFIYENDNFDAPWHFHPEHELTYIVKGEGIRYVGNNVQQFKEGDLVLIGANLPHCWKNVPIKEGKVKSLVIQWNDDLLGNDWLQKNEFQNIKNLLEKSLKGISFKAMYSAKTLNTFHDIMKKDAFEKLMLFLQLLEELSELKGTETLTSDGFLPNLNIKSNDRIDKIHDFVQLNYTQKISLNEVSGLVNLSDEAFCRFFKKTMNKSFFTYINEYRVNIACRLLIETNRQVSQIAYESGYESLPYFYRQFLKHVHCSPLAYKKMYKEVLS